LNIASLSFSDNPNLVNSEQMLLRISFEILASNFSAFSTIFEGSKSYIYNLSKFLKLDSTTVVNYLAYLPSPIESLTSTNYSPRFWVRS